MWTWKQWPINLWRFSLPGGLHGDPQQHLAHQHQLRGGRYDGDSESTVAAVSCKEEMMKIRAKIKAASMDSIASIHHHFLSCLTSPWPTFSWCSFTYTWPTGSASPVGLLAQRIEAPPVNSKMRSWAPVTCKPIRKWSACWKRRVTALLYWFRVNTFGSSGSPSDSSVPWKAILLSAARCTRRLVSWATTAVDQSPSMVKAFRPEPPWSWSRSKKLRLKSSTTTGFFVSKSLKLTCRRASVFPATLILPKAPRIPIPALSDLNDVAWTSMYISSPFSVFTW